MSFDPDQIAALQAPLSREHVKERDQGRSKVFYIEGWHAIAEANRIFGFDGWTRETVLSECCHAGEYEKSVWENGRKTNKTVTSYRCSYRAKVRVTARGIVREGTGHGHGFADNPGEAHESAEKEAETDAMKRALMTFGNPFGLALYDKKQENVESAPQRPSPGPRPVPARSPPAEAHPEPKAEHPRLEEARGYYKTIKTALRGARTTKQIDALMAVQKDNLEVIKEVDEQGYLKLMTLSVARTNELLLAA